MFQGKDFPWKGLSLERTVHNTEAGFNRLPFKPICSEKEALKLSYSASKHALITCRPSTELAAQGHEAKKTKFLSQR